MERCSLRLGARGTGGLQFETKWFYERARGQYLQKQMRMSPSEKKKFLLQNPKNQLITKTDLAKVRNTWEGLPHIVSKGAQTNFTEFAQKISDAWDKDEGLLFGDKYFQESVTLCLIFRYTEKMITREEDMALRIACQLPLKVPTPAQSKKLIALLERLYEEGFKL